MSSRQRYPELPPVVKLLLRRPRSNAAWKLVQTLAALGDYQPESRDVDVFVKIVAACPTQLERETLCDVGQPVFKYDLSETRARVEVGYLERVAAFDDSDNPFRAAGRRIIKRSRP